MYHEAGDRIFVVDDKGDALDATRPESDRSCAVKVFAIGSAHIAAIPALSECLLGVPIDRPHPDLS